MLRLPWLESWAAWERIVVILKADGPAVRILWSIDCNEACVTAAVRTTEADRHIVNLWTDIFSPAMRMVSHSVIVNLTVKFNTVSYIQQKCNLVWWKKLNMHVCNNRILIFLDGMGWGNVTNILWFLYNKFATPWRGRITLAFEHFYVFSILPRFLVLNPARTNHCRIFHTNIMYTQLMFSL